MRKRRTLIIGSSLFIITIIAVGIFILTNTKINNYFKKDSQSSTSTKVEKTEKEIIEKQLIEKSIGLKYIEKNNLKNYEVLQLLKYGYYNNSPAEKYIQVNYTYSCIDQTDDCVYYGQRLSDEGAEKTNYIFIIYKDKEILEIKKGVTIVPSNGFIFESGTIE